MTRGLLQTLLALLALVATSAWAEPRFAAQTGFRCAQCHVNPSGGGLRNAFGNAWAHTQLAQFPINLPSGVWTGSIAGRIGIGGNLRRDYEWSKVPGQGSSDDVRTQEGRVFLDLALLPGRLSVYVDRFLVPGKDENREANVRLWLRDGTVYLKAGRMYLPFGWRLEDDNAFVRQLSGFNMQAFDEAAEIGYENGPWSVQLAVSNGVGPGSGTPVTTRVEYVQSRWRLGASAAYADTSLGERRTVGLFGAYNLGPTTWLAEVDFVDDESIGVNGRQLMATLLEGNWLVHRGHNLKATFEWLDPDNDVDENAQTRASLVYEWTPIQFLQLRMGYRKYDGIRQSGFQNRSQAFVQLHGFF